MNIIVEEIVESVTILVDEITENVIIQVQEIVENVTVVIEEIGIQGEQGLSAYQIAVKNGFIGTEIEWSNSFKTIKLINLPLLP